MIIRTMGFFIKAFPRRIKRAN